MVFSPRRTSRKASGGVLLLGDNKYACRASGKARGRIC